MPTTKTVEINIVGGRISVKPEQIDLAVGDSVKFVTDSNTIAKFEILFHNATNYFNGKDRIYRLIIDKNTSKTEQISWPNNNYPLIYYSVCQDQSPGSQPLPPDAPPRIIINH